MDLEVLVVGGGIHGVGVLHDLASRGLGGGVHLVERHGLASGTSSRSTKLLHGGLRYLEHPAQWGLVREALAERTFLLGLLPGTVRPLPIVLPAVRGGRPPWMLRLGLWLYDHLAGPTGLPPGRPLDGGELLRLAPYLSERAREGLRAAFLYHDAQMRDDALVRLVAAAAGKLGASAAEQTSAEAVAPAAGGYRVDLRGPAGRDTVTARAVVNAAGAWGTANLLRWGFRPRTSSVLNVGSHLVFRPSLVPADPDRLAGTLFQNDDGRVVFFLPWFGRWLLGTTESVLTGDPDGLAVPEADRDYLLRAARFFLGAARPEDHLEDAFAGVRTMPVPASEPGPLREAWREDPFASPFYLRSYPRSLSAASREAVVEESGAGLLSLYGGKYTTYRAQAARLGDRLAAHLGLRRPSATRDPSRWFLPELREERPDLFGPPPRA